MMVILWYWLFIQKVVIHLPLVHYEEILRIKFYDKIIKYNKGIKIDLYGIIFKDIQITILMRVVILIIILIYDI